MFEEIYLTIIDVTGRFAAMNDVLLHLYLGIVMCGPSYDGVLVQHA